MTTFWKNNPAFKIAIPFVLGIVIGVLLKLENPFFIAVSAGFIGLSGGAFIFKKYKYRFLQGALLFVSILFLGVSLVIIKTEIFQKEHFSYSLNSNSYVVAHIDEALIKKAKSEKTVLVVDYIINDGVVKPVKGNILTYFKLDSLKGKLKYGDQLIFKGYVNEVTAPSNPEQFNYKHYLTLNNIYHQVFLSERNFIKTGKNCGSELIAFSYSAREYLYQQLQVNGVEGDELKVASALLLGYRELLDQELIQAYSSAGAMHVLAVSGLHVGILFFILKFSLSFFLRLKRGKYLFTLIILAALWGYALITGFSPSVLRATTMFSFILIGEQMINRKASIYNTLAVSAIILLIVNPYLIFEVGFQLSYLAVVGIVYLQPKIYSLLTPRNLVLDNAWKITAVSIAAQIATFPLGLYYFHQFPVYFFISNLIVIPAATVILYLGVLLFITSPIGGVSLIFGKLLSWVIMGLNLTVQFTENLPFSLVQEISVSRLDTYLLYLFIITSLVFIHYRKIKYFYFSGFILLSFISIQLIDRYSDLYRKDFTVYSIQNETAFEFSSGNKTYLVASPELIQNEAQLLFNIKHNWYRKNITSIHHLNVDSIYNQTDYLFANKGVIRFYGKTFAFLNHQNFKLIQKLKPHFIIVSSKNYKLLYQIENALSFDCKIIFDSTIKDHYYQYWKKRLKGYRTISTVNTYFNEVLLD